MIFGRYILFFFGILSLLLGYYPTDEADKDPELTKVLNYYHTHKRMLKDLFNALEKIELNFYLHKDEDNWHLMLNHKDSLTISSDSIVSFFNHRNINVSTLKEIGYIKKISSDSITIRIKNFPKVFFKKKYLSSQINYDKAVVKKDGMGHTHISIDDKIDISFMRRLDFYVLNKGIHKFFIQLGWFLIVISLIIFLLEKIIAKFN